MTIKGTTQLLGVIGYPIAHSFSPLMHNAAIAHLNQIAPDTSGKADYVYLPFPVHPDDLEKAIAGFAAIGLRGFNITIPHKQSILPLLDEVSEVAQAIGAVNTVWRTDTQWCGTNTDVVGFLAPLKAMSRDWANTPAMILGCGGAARAVVAACHQLGCPQIWVVGRSPDKLAKLVQSWSALDIQAKLSGILWHDLAAYLPSCGLLVNATPIGMHPHEGVSPLSAKEMGKMEGKAIAYDLIYTPRPTQFLQAASAAGLTVIDGLEMLVQQGAAALEIWLAQPAPVEIMRQTLLDYLVQHEPRK
jgi:shikimate dehydrogenase